MSCYHPLPAIQRKEGGQIEFVNKEALIKDARGEVFAPFGYRYLEVPCGKCIGCRLDYSKQWATRIMKEAEQWENNWFLTLTYDPENVPWQSSINLETGEYVQGMTLQPEHLTKFLKDLRRYWKYHYNEDNIRFYACGEYGGKTQRPHYHVAVMNWNIPGGLLKEWKKSQNGMYYQCETVAKIWKKGFICLAKLEWESAAYVARYMLKKQKGKDADQYYKSMAQIPEFTRCSRNPGIAREWYEQNKDKIYKNDEMFIARKGGAQKVKPPAYYDKLFDVEDHERMQEIKEERRKAANEASRRKRANTTLNDEEQRKVEENKKEEQIKKLKRQIEL